jgi:pimeloyl-ACP methyl ester carboxylesterase
MKRTPARIAITGMVGLLLVRPTASEETHPTDRRETVVLLHGLSRTERSMRRLGAALSRGGYDVVNVGYPAGRRPIEALSSDLDVRLRAIRRTPDRRVHFVTHSFGGILLRYYLREKPLPNLGRVVMLSPPNGGSELADRLSGIPLVRKAAGPNRPRLGTDPAGLPARLGPVDFDLGVITGDRSINPVFSALIPGPDDGFVAVERAKIRGMNDFLVVPCTHAFIMRSKRVIGQTLKFLREGSFDHRTPA